MVGNIGDILISTGHENFTSIAPGERIKIIKHSEIHYNCYDCLNLDTNVKTVLHRSWLNGYYFKIPEIEKVKRILRYYEN